MPYVSQEKNIMLYLSFLAQITSFWKKFLEEQLRKLLPFFLPQPGKGGDQFPHFLSPIQI